MDQETKLINYAPDKLINYLPEFLQDIREYQTLLAAEDHEINEIWDAIEKAFQDQTVDTATEYGLSRLEKILRIIPKSLDKENRRLEIKARLGQQLPYTIRILKGILTTLCDLGESDADESLKGYELLFPEAYTLKILIDLRNKSKKSAIDTMVRQICPANILCLIDLDYNTYGNLRKRRLTHAQLSQLTHQQIQDDVLDDYFPENELPKL